MILQQLITGVSIGSVYALLAVGYALVFSVFNFSNFGFGPVMMLGAFGALFAIERTHMALFPGILVALAVAAVISLLMEVTIYRPMRQKKALKVYLMIAALGINTCVPNFCIQLWGGAVRPFHPTGQSRDPYRQYRHSQGGHSGRGFIRHHADPSLVFPVQDKNRSGNPGQRL